MSIGIKPDLLAQLYPVFIWDKFAHPRQTQVIPMHLLAVMFSAGTNPMELASPITELEVSATGQADLAILKWGIADTPRVTPGVCATPVLACGRVLSCFGDEHFAVADWAQVRP